MTSTQRLRMRRGSAATEMALVLPVLLVVVFGVLSVGQLIYFRKSLVVAAYEGARLASKRTSTNAEVTTRVEQILTARRVTGAMVTVTPTTVEGLASGDLITIRVQAPFQALNGSGYAKMFERTIAADAAILRE